MEWQCALCKGFSVLPPKGEATSEADGKVFRICCEPTVAGAEARARLCARQHTDNVLKRNGNY